jgi:hypothetical protein
MHKRTLPRLAGSGWCRPYGTSPFSPIFYADGGDGDASGSGSQGGSGDGKGEGQQGGQPGGQNGGDLGSGQGGSGGSGQDAAATIARLEKQLADARAEAGKARITAKQNAADEAVKQLTQDIGKALGLIKDDENADPAELTKKLTKAQQDARTTAVELAIYKGARGAGGDADALLDSRSFTDSLADIDPADGKAITEAIKAAVKDNAKLRAHQGAGRSGADISGGSGDQPTSLDKQIEEATKRRDFAAVIRLKRQRAAQT